MFIVHKILKKKPLNKQTRSHVPYQYREGYVHYTNHLIKIEKKNFAILSQLKSAYEKFK